MDTQKIKILYAAAYDMNTEQGHRSGVSVQYMFYGEKGELLEAKNVDPKQPNGARIAKDSLDPGYVDNLVMVPGIYEATFSMRVGSDGRPVNRLTSIHFIGTEKSTFVPVQPSAVSK